MYNIRKEDYGSIVKLLTECFIEDQLIVKQIKGMKHPKSFLRKLFLLQLQIMGKTCEMKSADEKLNSIIVGYEKKKYNLFLAIVLSIIDELIYSNPTYRKIKTLPETTGFFLKRGSYNFRLHRGYILTLVCSKRKL